MEINDQSETSGKIQSSGREEPSADSNGRRLSGRQTWAEVDLRSLSQNYRGLCSLLTPPPAKNAAAAPGPPPRIIPVIKANAYGHGAVPTARALVDSGAAMFAIGNVEEGVALRQGGISQDLLVLATTWQGQEAAALEHGLILAVDSVQGLELLRAAADRKPGPVSVHLKVDTGMGRLGIRWDSMGPFVRLLKQSTHISLKGVFTHLSSADDPNPSHTLKQKDRFESALLEIRNAGLDPGEIHCANSAGFLYHESLRKWSSRIGIALYGYAPAAGESPVPLRPVLSLKTRVGHLRRILPGESIGYGRKFIASRETRYTTLPIGYADGLPRRLSGNCRVIIRDGWAEVIGTISMDMIAVDLTDRPDVREGDEVLLLGSSGNCSVTADQWADTLETIPYEILCGIAARVPRIYM